MGDATDKQTNAEPADVEGPVPAKNDGYWAIVRRQFWKRRLNRVASWVILLLFVVAMVADFIASDLPIAVSLEGNTYIAPNVFRPPELRRWDNQLLLEEMGEDDWAVFPPVPWGYNSHDLDAVLAPPGPDHPLGTDSEGRDVMARVVHGARVSLAVGVLSVAALVIIGVVLGSVAAYWGGAFDLILMRLLEIVHALPTILLLVTILSVVMLTGWASIVGMMLVIGMVGWTGVARLVRGEILKIKTMEYVEAARALGYTHTRIIVRHILPNAISPVLVSATFSMAAAILIESALSFLGFGIPPDMASWGALLSDGREHVDAWWLALFPGAAIFITVTVYNMAGEGLRDAIDPRLKL